MQDSIEDYIKLINNTKEVKTNSTEGNEKLLAVQRKRDCDSYSLKIVEFLIEGQLRPEAFLKCLNHINQATYQDIVEERAITNICGYPLCGRKLPEMPKKQYLIATKNNKIYDITDRKNFCCNFCYTASFHVKNQIQTSPLWLRKPGDFYNFTLLPYTGDEGQPGCEIVQGINSSEIDKGFTSVSSFTECSLAEVQELEMYSGAQQKEKKLVDKNRKYKMQFLNLKQYNSIYEDDEELVEEADLDCDEDEPNGSSDEEPDDLKIAQKIEQVKNKKVSIKQKDTSGQSSKRTEEDRLRAVIEKCKAQNKKEKKVLYTDIVPAKPQICNFENGTTEASNNVAIELDDCQKLNSYIKEWISLETYIFLHGIEKVKTYLNESTMSEYFDELKINERELQQQVKYMNICKRLQLQEIAENKFDSCVKSERFRPLPDYGKLKQDSKELNLKVRSFYGGELSYANEKKKDSTESDQNENPSSTTFTSLSERNRINGLRRKVLITTLQKKMRLHAENLMLNTTQIMEDFQLLAKTFALDANNVVIKATHLDMICLICISLLAIRNRSLRLRLEEERSKSYVNLHLDKYLGGASFANAIISYANDVDNFVKSSVCKEIND